MAAAGDWTAYFVCSLRGTDAAPPIGYLAEALGCRGLVVMSEPHTEGLPGVRDGRYGSVQFELFGPDRTEWLNSVRAIATAYDGSRWVFQTAGTPRTSRSPTRTGLAGVRDRFTSEMLERYCKTLGVDVFDPSFYGPETVYFERKVVTAPDGLVLSLDQAQAWLEITPGMADDLPG